MCVCVCDSGTRQINVNIFISLIGNALNSQSNQTYTFQLKADQSRIDAISFDFNMEQKSFDFLNETATLNTTESVKSYTILRLYSNLTNETIINLNMEIINSNKYLRINNKQIAVKRSFNKFDKILFEFNSTNGFIEMFINSIYYLRIMYKNESNNGFYSIRIGSEVCVDNLNLRLFSMISRSSPEISLADQYHNQTLNRYFSFFKITNKNCLTPVGFNEASLAFVNTQTESNSMFYLCEQNQCVNNSTCENIINIYFSGISNSQVQQYPSYITTTASPYFQKNVILKSDYNCQCKDGLRLSGRTCSIKKSICDHEFFCLNDATCVQRDDDRLSSCVCSKNYVGERCEIYDPCHENLCSPLYSTCQEKKGSQGYECICETGYMGEFCETKISETCYLENQCKNNGQCVDSYDNGNLKYECKCTNEFSGKNCENFVDYCASMRPCKNNATCYNLQSTNTDQYACICTKGWKGLDCDEDIDECTDFPNLCKNNGDCNNFLGSFECNCKSEYYYGQYCERKHVCIDDFSAPLETKLCKHDGKCIIKGDVEENLHECECEYGFEGEMCTIITCGTNPCNNNGTCVDLELNDTISVIHYECICNNTGYTGPLCNDLIVVNNATFVCTKNSTLDCDNQLVEFRLLNGQVVKTFDNEPGRPQKEIYYNFILWPLLGFLLILIMSLLLIIISRMKKTRATRGTYSPSRHEQHSSRIEFNMDLKRPIEERLI